MVDNPKSMLHGYRVLDLTDEKGFLCGKILGDIGADVIKIEKPGGDPSRKIGPFYHNEIDPEKSLLWFALNTSKRGITLDIEKSDGQELFKRLVKTSDFVIESFSPGYLDKLGLGYTELEKLNPKMIMVSITPFGQTGPYRDYKAPDIVAFAIGGAMYPWGDPDRSPVRVSHHSQSYLNAASEAAVGAMMALYQRHITGEGQQVDVSIQEAVCALVPTTVNFNELNPEPAPRGGMPLTARLRLPYMWPCQDGFVIFVFYFGGERATRRTRPLIQYMDDEGMSDNFLNGIDWAGLDAMNMKQEFLDEVEVRVRKFFMSHTKNELFSSGLKYDAPIYPVASSVEIATNEQLTARGYWVDLKHKELGHSITYPGAFAKMSETPAKVSCRAPLIGEHNQEIYEELGLSQESLLMLKQAGVI